MKRKPIGVLVTTVIFLAACGNGGDKNGHQEHGMTKDTTKKVTATTGEKEIKAIAVTYSNLDTQIAASFKEIVDHYLHIKNALANDDAYKAANGAKAMRKVLNQLDKSYFTSEQKATYDQDEEELKEHAEHIGKNGDNIKHQRSHFSLLSEVMYDLVKAFGGGQPLYHDHCPMYNEEKGGAMWLSETVEVKNPYFGAEMSKCGTVEEVIK